MSTVNGLPTGAGLDGYIIKGFYPTRTQTTVTVQYGKTFTKPPTIERFEVWQGTDHVNLFNDPSNIYNVNIGLSSITFTKGGQMTYNDWGGLLVMKANQ